ncbi:oxidoreductase AflY-like [Bradysia coprophila]|uniref:oxidoreductase AflY-like n=1 Tax=Bradysia coprophila TaxID=38358 RepID=UPI00187D94C1|nr:oxidoreductase AflY-like [Bradysia coprophila]XP_037040048.1 oxidoreductase AflY-like [Bradysia coprophila]
MACLNSPRTAAGAYELTKNLLIKAHAEYDINYRGYLANHLPHGLYTLCALGASTSRLQQFYDKYVKKLEPISKTSTVIDSSNWETNIGCKGSYSDYLRYFDNELEVKGLKNTFDLYFSQLMGESLGAALHPLINIGYAMEFKNPILLSEGLAYVCITPLRDTSKILNNADVIGASSDTTIFQLIEELQSIKFPEIHNDGWNFQRKTEFLLENYGMVFRDLIAKWDLTQGDKLLDKLNELTEASILAVFGTYPKQIDFFLLHGLTGNHAVRILFQNLPEALQRQILKVNLLGFLTDYVVQRCPKVDINFITGYKETNGNLTWDVILDKTISTDEVHVPKVIRCLTHFMEAVPLPQRSKLFTDTFLKQCAIKLVDIVQEEEDFLF